MRNPILRLWISTFFLATSIAFAIHVNKVELKLAVVSGNRVSIYPDYPNDYYGGYEEYFKNGESFIVTPAATGGSTINYYADEKLETSGYDSFSDGGGLEIKNLSGIVTANTNIRDLPSASGKKVTTASAGAIVTILSRTTKLYSISGYASDYYWFEIKTKSGKKGWVYGGNIGILEPDQAIKEATAAIENGNPVRAIIILRETKSRFPSGLFVYQGKTFDDKYYNFAPTSELLIGQAFFLNGKPDAAKSRYADAMDYGESKAFTTLKIIDAKTGKSFYKRCDYNADTLAKIGLGYSTANTNADKAAVYFASAIADAESGLSTTNVIPEYFDALIIRNLAAGFEAEEISSICMDALAKKLPDKCKYDFAPAYFKLYYGEALQRIGSSGRSVKLYKNIVENFSDAYLYDQDGYYTGYTFIDLSARAFFNIMEIQDRLGEIESFASYCEILSEKQTDKRVAFLASFIAGIALESINEREWALKEYYSAQRFLEVSNLEKNEHYWFYSKLEQAMNARIKSTKAQDYGLNYFKGY